MEDDPSAFAWGGDEVSQLGRYSPNPILFGSPDYIPGELPSTWVRRLAQKHERPISSILMALGWEQSGRLFDFSSCYPDIERIATSTGSDKAAVTKAFHYKRTLIADPSYSCLTHYMGKGRWPIYKYCPICWQSDAIPYYRIFWRFAFSFVCPVHGQLLRNRCPHCGKLLKINLSRRATSGIPRYPIEITWCPFCQGDLTDCDAVSLPQRELRLLSNTQTRIDSVILDGRYSHPSAGTISSRLFLEVFMRTAMVPSDGPESHHQIRKYVGINFEKLFGVPMAMQLQERAMIQLER